MNDDCARELTEGGWHWTRMNGDQIRTAAPCRLYIGPTDKPIWDPVYTDPANWQRCEPHATREEAERHFYDYCLENLVTETTEWMNCQAKDCDAPARLWHHNRGIGMAFSGGLSLCTNHYPYADELIQERYPFESGMQIWHS